MTNNDQDAKIKLVANIRLDRARLYSFENKTRTSKDQKRRKKKKQDTLNLQRPTTRRKSISAV